MKPVSFGWRRDPKGTATRRRFSPGSRRSAIYEDEMDRSWAKRPGRIDNGFGHQIRSYVMHPYTAVRDLRTDMETADLKSVLDGDIDAFLEAEIIRRKNLRQNPDSAVLD